MTLARTTHMQLQRFRCFMIRLVELDKTSGILPSSSWITIVAMVMLEFDTGAVNSMETIKASIASITLSLNTTILFEIVTA